MEDVSQSGSAKFPSSVALSGGRPTLVDWAIQALRKEILSGRLRPEERIHLGDAARRLGVSPGPVREALRSLAAEGLVVPVSQRGYRVTPISLDELEDIYRLRLRLDPLAVKLAVPRINEEQLDGVEVALARLEESVRALDWDAHGHNHRRFHFGIYEACGSAWLLRILAMLWDNSVRYQRLSTLTRGTLDERTEEHRQIMLACHARNAERAAQLMEEHLRLTVTGVRNLLNSPAGLITA